MANYFIEGNLGAGKSIIAVGRIQEKYLRLGLPVATNLDINIEVLTNKFDNTSTLYRLPDQPRIEDLLNLPNANPGYDESKNGAIFLDECATWLNSRSWNDKTRKPVIDWLVHARKYGWNVYFIIQSVKAIDAQIRDMLMEHVVTCKRLDRMGVPILGPMVRYLSLGTVRLQMPRMHIGSVIYVPTEQKVDSWSTRGTAVYDAYDTKQIFSHDYIADDKESGVAGVYQLLRPYHKFGRYMLKRDKDFYMRLSKIYFKKLGVILGFSSGLMLSILIMLIYIAVTPETTEKKVEISTKETEAVVMKTKSDYKIVSTSSYVTVSALPNNSKSNNSIFISNGQKTVKISDLQNIGYTHKRFSECYHLLESVNEVITVTCGEIEKLSG